MATRLQKKSKSETIQLGPISNCFVNGQHEGSWDRRNLHQIDYNGHDGDDVFKNNTELATYAVGGEGNDTIYGGSGSDTLYGGVDDDFLSGGYGERILCTVENGHDAASTAAGMTTIS